MRHDGHCEFPADRLIGGNLLRIICDNGKSDYAVAVTSDSAPPERFAASELQKYVRLISGVELPVIHTLDRRTVLAIGSIAERIALAPVSLGDDAYVVQTRDESVILAGGSPRATLYAVYHLLERHMGCGWCVPGDDTVPRQDRIALGEIDDRERPVYSLRALVEFPFEPERSRKLADWCAKNRLNGVRPATNGPELWDAYDARHSVVPEYVRRGLRVLWGGHTFLTWLPAPEYFDRHPEYFALTNGERKPPHLAGGALCVSHPEVPRIVAQNILRFVEHNPEVEAVDLWMNDTEDWCECAHCAEMEGPSDYARFRDVLRPPDQEQPFRARSRAYYAFVNRVAALVAECAPDLVISPLAYACCYEPPLDIQLAPNVLLGFATFYREATKPLTACGVTRNRACLDLIRSWRRKTDRLYVYEYYSHWALNPLSPQLGNVAQMASELGHYPSIGVDMICSEGARWRPLVMYAYSRLAWNPSLTAPDIIADFCARHYGEAAPAMTDFWLAQEETGGDWGARQATGLRLLASASSDVAEAQVVRRIAHLQEILRMDERSPVALSAWVSYLTSRATQRSQPDCALEARGRLTWGV